MMNPRTPEDVIMDFKGRRAGILKALTKDVESFYLQCDSSNNRNNLCLYGFSNQQWEVNLPQNIYNSDLPVPRLGINFARDVMKKQDWLSMVALHSDAWLNAIASYYVAKFKFDKSDRKRVFNKIAEFPSIGEAMLGDAKKRARLKNQCFLAEELVVGILARLPVRDVVKCRLVCKKWVGLIDDPRFVSIHRNTYRSNVEKSHLLVIQRPKTWVRKEQVLVRRVDTFRKVLELNELDGEGSSRDLNYINGVMLIRRGNYRVLRDIILWNPSMNRSIKVCASIIQELRQAPYFELGFGFDAFSNDFKVIAIVYPVAEVKYSNGDRWRLLVPGFVYVYTLRTNCWSCKVGIDPPPYWTVGSQVFVNNSIHWINLGPKIMDNDSWYKKKDGYLVSFDVGKEEFGYMELPSHEIMGCWEDSFTEKNLMVLNGSLGIFCTNQRYNEIWVMEEYGVGSSWNKRYKFELQFDNFLYFRSNAELLFASNGKGVKSYDVNKKVVRDLAKTYCRSSTYAVYAYVETLALGYNNKSTKSNI